MPPQSTTWGAVVARISALFSCGFHALFYVTSLEPTSWHAASFFAGRRARHHKRLGGAGLKRLSHMAVHIPRHPLMSRVPKARLSMRRPSPSRLLGRAVGQPIVVMNIDANEFRTSSSVLSRLTRA